MLKSAVFMDLFLFVIISYSHADLFHYLLYDLLWAQFPWDFTYGKTLSSGLKVISSRKELYFLLPGIWDTTNLELF